MIISLQGDFLMKKIYLLPCVLFLALTGCNNKKSDKDRTEPLTEAEIVDVITNGSYTVDVNESYYDEGRKEYADVIEYRLLKEGLKFESQQFVEEEESDHFAPVGYLDARDTEHVYEFSYNGNYKDWIREELTQEDYQEGLELILQELSFVKKFVGVKEATWGLNENTYHGELVLKDEKNISHTYIIDVKVNTKYVEDILFQDIDEDKFHEDYHYAFSNWDATTVELPYTFEQLWDEMVRYDKKAEDVLSYKLEYTIESESPRRGDEPKFNFEYVDDEANQTYTMRAVEYQEGNDTFVQYHYNATTYDYYHVNQNGVFVKETVDTLPDEFLHLFVPMHNALNAYLDGNTVENLRPYVASYEQLHDGFEFTTSEPGPAQGDTIEMTLEVHVNDKEEFTSLSVMRRMPDYVGGATLRYTDHGKVSITLPTIQ